MNDVLDRLKEIMEREGISPSALADSVNISRPLLSHVLSGRNKPSLQLVFKVLENYPEYSADWLLFGKEAEIKKPDEENYSSSPPATPKFPLSEPFISSPDRISGKIESSEQNNEIEKIIVFYRNKTFDVYKPQ